MPQIPGAAQLGSQGAFGPQDVQAALSHGSQTANQTARTVTQSTQPFIQASGQMLQEQMADKRHKREIEMRKRELFANTMMQGLGLVTDTAFNAIGAGIDISAAGGLKDLVGLEVEAAKRATEKSSTPDWPTIDFGLED